MNATFLAEDLFSPFFSSKKLIFTFLSGARRAGADGGIEIETPDMYQQEPFIVWPIVIIIIIID